MTAYKTLWLRRDIRAPFVYLLIGRMPMGMLGLSLVLYVVHEGGGYAQAGLAVAALPLGSGLVMALLGRAVDRLGRTPVLLSTTAAHSALLLTLLAVPVSSPAFVALCLAAGVAYPPLNPSARALWRDVLDGDALSAMHGLDATTQELGYIAGPMLAAMLAAFVGPAAALVAAVACGLVGVVLFALSRLVRTAARVVVPAGGSRRLLPLLWPVASAATLLVVGLSIVEISVIASVQHDGASAAAGILISVWSVGSLIGGFLFGAWASRRDGSRLPLLLALTAGGFTVLAAPVGLWLLGLLLAAGGAAIAPTMAALQARIAALAPEGRAAEAFGWLATAFLAGAAGGAALGGWLAGSFGSGTAFLVAGLLTVPGAAATLLGHRAPRPAPCLALAGRSGS